MTDIRQQLNDRLTELRQNAARNQAWVDKSAEPGSVRFEMASRAIAELHQVESILAQMQLADAQRVSAAAQREVASAQREVAQAQRDATAASDAERAWTEGRAFWLRRLVTSLAVAFGAASFAAVSALLRPDPPVASVRDVHVILALFLGGTLLTGGVLPLLLAWKPTIQPGDATSRGVQLFAWALSSLAAVGLVVGIAIVTRVGVATFHKRSQQVAARPLVPVAQERPPTHLGGRRHE